MPNSPLKTGLLSVPNEVWKHHLSPFLAPTEFINFFRKTCKSLLVSPKLEKCRLNRAFLDGKWTNAIKNNKPNIVLSIILSRPDRNPSKTGGDWRWTYTLTWASYYSYHEIVRLLLTDQRVNPAANDNYSIKWAARNGHLDIVRLLLADQRVNPAVEGNEAIRKASRNGHLDIVRLLLADQRVNPAEIDNYAIKYAARNKHTQIVQLLLNHILMKLMRRNPSKSPSYPQHIHDLALKEDGEGFPLLYTLMQESLNLYNTK
jgi:ankyrin repeat protein